MTISVDCQDVVVVVVVKWHEGSSDLTLGFSSQMETLHQLSLLLLELELCFKCLTGDFLIFTQYEEKLVDYGFQSFIILEMSFLMYSMHLKLIANQHYYFE